MNQPPPPPGFVPVPAQSTGDGTLSYDQLRNLAEYAGLDPRYSGLMARVAMAESGGNPQSNRSGATNYQEGGKTYYPQGLWQISTIHGQPGMFSPIANAQEMVRLFNSQGLSPWEASRVQKGGGGWGQYVNAELGLPPTAHGSHFGGDPSNFALVGDYTLPTGAPSPPPGFVPVGGGSAPSPPPGFVPVGGTAPPPPPGFVPQGAAPPFRVGGIGDIAHSAGSLAGKLVTGQKIRPQGPVENWMMHTIAAGRAGAVWLAKNAMTGLLNIMGTPSRVVTAGLAEAPHGLEASLKAAGQAIFNASDAEVAKGTTGTEALFRLPSHQWIDGFATSITSAAPQLRPYVAGLLKAGEDFGVQMAADPTSYIPAVGEFSMAAKFLRYIQPLYAGARLTHLVYSAGKAAGIGEKLGHLGPLGDVYTDTIGQLTKFYKDFFTVRPELDGFSPEFREGIILRDNARATRDTMESDLDVKALRSRDPEQAKQRFLRYYAQYGSTKNAKATLDEGFKADAVDPETGVPIVPHPQTGIAQKFMPGTLKEPNLKTALRLFMDRKPGETDQELYDRQLGVLDELRGKASKGQTKADALDLLTTHGFKGKIGDRTYNDEAALKGWNKKGGIPTGEQARAALEKRFQTLQGLRTLRNWSRNAILWNPMPHEIKNMGQLAFLAGGPKAIALAWKYAIEGAPPARVAYLNSLGAGVPEFLTRMERVSKFPSEEGKSIWHLEPGKQVGTLFGMIKPAAQKLELGYRLALLDILEKQGVKDDIVKGWTISQRLGDYRNTSAVVHIMSSLGGPFMAFRAGIIPAQVTRAIMERPDRVLAILRAQYDVNADRMGGRKNELEFGGVVSDFAKLAFAPQSYIEASLPWEELEQGFGHMSLARIGMRIFEQYVKYGSAMVDAYRDVIGKAMPTGYAPKSGMPEFQHMTLTDQIMTAFLFALGSYYHPRETQKQMHARYERYLKQGF